MSPGEHLSTAKASGTERSQLPGCASSKKLPARAAAGPEHRMRPLPVNALLGAGRILSPCLLSCVASLRSVS